MKLTACVRMNAIDREFKDVVFEDVVFDNNRSGIDVTIKTKDNRVANLLLSNTTSSNTTSLNSRVKHACAHACMRACVHALLYVRYGILPMISYA